MGQALTDKGDDGIDHMDEARLRGRLMQHGDGYIHDPWAVRRIARHADNGGPGLRHAHHDFADGFAGIFVRLPKQKARSVDDMFGKGILDHGQVFLIAVRFGLIKNLAHEVQAGIRPHPTQNTYGPGIRFHCVALQRLNLAARQFS